MWHRFSSTGIKFIAVNNQSIEGQRVEFNEVLVFKGQEKHNVRSSKR